MRVPVTDEKAPKEHDFTLLIQRLWTLPEGAALVFNCQMGRGRTTTGMIIASLLHIRRKHGSLNLPPAPQGGPACLVRNQKGHRCVCAPLSCIVSLLRTQHKLRSFHSCRLLHEVGAGEVPCLQHTFSAQVGSCAG